MKIVAIASLKGGTGRTTVTANLASVLAHHGRAAAAFDLDPQNALGLHFGMRPSEPVGLSWPGIDASRVHDFAARNPGRVPFLPFGAPRGEALANFERDVARDEDWLARKVKLLAPRDCDVLLLDLPAKVGPLTAQALGLADLVLVVLLADAASYATIPRTERLLEDYPPTHDRSRSVSYLLNQTDARHAVDRDVAASVHYTLPGKPLPFTIPRDEAICEALARQRPLLEEAPGSRALDAFFGLATWLLARNERRLQPVEGAPSQLLTQV